MTLFDIIAAIVTALFLAYILSYYLLLFVRQKKASRQKFKSITVIIPAHNEERYIESCIDSVLKAKWNGLKQIIVIDDGSKDSTYKLASNFDVTLLGNKHHSGKSTSLNKALSHAKGELTAIVDGDSIIAEDALIEAAKVASKKNTAAVCAVVRVKNKRSFINFWVHVELVYNNLIRSLFSRIQANIVTAGALSVYRTGPLREIGGFNTEGFSEDVDVAIRLIRKGYHIGFADKAISDTNMPDDIKGFFRQRTRLARGQINLLKRHMQINKTVIDLYTLPLWAFNYFQSVVMSAITIFNIVSGYLLYFASKGIYFNFSVARFLFDWFSMIGFVRWSYEVFLGASPITFLAAVGIASTLLSYPLMIYAFFKYDRLTIIDALAIFFMLPYWLLLMVIYTIMLPELLRKEQFNIWKKNE